MKTIAREFRACGETLIERADLFLGAALLGIICGIFVCAIRDLPTRTPEQQEAYVQQMSTLDWLN